MMPRDAGMDRNQGVEDDLENPVFQRLWLLHKILGVSPFSEEILSLNLYQSDLIIRRWLKDVEMESGKNTAIQKAKMLEDPNLLRWRESYKEWAGKLKGNALKEFVRNPGKFAPPEES